MSKIEDPDFATGLDESYVLLHSCLFVQEDLSPVLGYRMNSAGGKTNLDAALQSCVGGFLESLKYS